MGGLCSWVGVVSLLLAPAVGAAEDEPFLLAPDSTLTFEATQAGSRFSGRFESFTARIVFDPEALELSSFDVRISVASIDTDYRDRDEILRGVDFFDVGKYPEATFVANRFSRQGPDQFVATGVLRIKDTARALELPFSFAPSPAIAGKSLLTGSVVINRLDFGVGGGEWRDPKWIGHNVTVNFRLALDGGPI